MQAAILEYFAGEKQAGVLVAIVGALAVVAGLLLWRTRRRAFAVMLGVLGLLELGVGIGLFLKTGPQVDGLVARLGADAVGVRAEEAVRMARVQRNFSLLEVMWLVMIAAAGTVVLTQRRRPGLRGASLGLLLHASFMLVFDLVAERRGAVYVRALAGPPEG